MKDTPFSFFVELFQIVCDILSMIFMIFDITNTKLLGKERALLRMYNGGWELRSGLSHSSAGGLRLFVLSKDGAGMFPPAK